MEQEQLHRGGNREIVIPGDLLDDSGRMKDGPGCYQKDGRIFASRLGLKQAKGDTLSVLPLSGVYNPFAGDLVIGVVVELGPSMWLLDINGPYPAPLHATETPWRVDFGETAKYLDAGDTILCKVLFVDETKKTQVTMKDRNLKKLTGGHVVEVEPSKVPRVIGKNGSMVNLIKKYCDVWMFVGQNGRIWLNGDLQGILLAEEAIRKIEREAHTQGLTDRVQAYLRDEAAKLGRKVHEGQAEEASAAGGEEGPSFGSTRREDDFE
jgi:exosome complex component RRP4